MPPPAALAVLLEVGLPGTTKGAPTMERAPPLPYLARPAALPESVLPVIVRSATPQMPPPSYPAVLPDTVLDVMVRLPSFFPKLPAFQTPPPEKLAALPEM